MSRVSPSARASRATCAPDTAEGNESEIELRQTFDLEDFAPSEAVDHHRELGKQLAERK
ncbi:MAG TPA: hypothetical protein VLW25_08480 [Bryobacteraceae bacterium]|nr:hypothetical protein [Bryobacteraceae bacterium]